MISRRAIIAEARDWLGTPYVHQASAKGAGCDCLGLVRGVWRALYGAEPESTPPYTPDWAERAGAETLHAAARRHLREIDMSAAAPGDVLLFRMDARAPMKHAAILDDEARLIHAYWGRAVVRSRFAPWWRARLAAAFSFPDVSPWPNSFSLP
ncbi:MAG: NlpC/P60 family protein [Hyphomonadaceae bacterium]